MQDKRRALNCIKKPLALALCLYLTGVQGIFVCADETTIDVSSGEVFMPEDSDDVEKAPASSSLPSYSSGSQSQSTYQPQTSYTGRQLESARQEKNSVENKLSRTEETIENLNEERSDLGTYMEQINQKLQEAIGLLNEYEELLDNKEKNIENAQKTLTETKELQVQRKKDMKGRIKYMYEQGSESYLDILMTARSFSDFLNKAAYFESINQYDKKMLEEYSKTQKEIAEEEEDLVMEKEALETLRAEAEQKAAEVSQEVAATSASLKEYSDEIAKREEEAYAYEQELKEKENDIAALQEQYKKELALSVESAAMGSRDLSDVTFAAGDLDLMAAMIECEAGGESYTGKVAVGAVILNRVRSPKFPSTVLEVLMQNRQFSPVASGRFALVLARGANESCYQAARDAMSGASPVGGCLFFRTPIPGLTGQQIGGHIFY